MQKTTNISINLAKNRGDSLLDRVIAFALTAGRIVVIGTELIALSAFLYRFTLDQTLVQLHDKITQEQAVVHLLKDNETSFRNLQDRLNFSASLIKQGSAFPTILADVFSFAPPDMNIHTISITPEGVRIDATMQSVISLSDFIDKLKAYPSVTSVSLDRISNQTETSTITVDITAYLKQIAAEKTATQNSTTP